MAKYPGAAWRPVTRYQSGSLHVRGTMRRLILHTAVSSASSMHGFFNVSGHATPHFYVNDAGEIEQYIDTDYRSTANLYGGRGISPPYAIALPIAPASHSPITFNMLNAIILCAVIVIVT